MGEAGVKFTCVGVACVRASPLTSQPTTARSLTGGLPWMARCPVTTTRSVMRRRRRYIHRRPARHRDSTAARPPPPLQYTRPARVEPLLQLVWGPGADGGASIGDVHAARAFGEAQRASMPVRACRCSSGALLCPPFEFCGACVGSLVRWCVPKVPWRPSYITPPPARLRGDIVARPWSECLLVAVRPCCARRACCCWNAPSINSSSKLCAVVE
jgi:hypothetical protein